MFLTVSPASITSDGIRRTKRVLSIASLRLPLLKNNLLHFRFLLSIIFIVRVLNSQTLSSPLDDGIQRGKKKCEIINSLSLCCARILEIRDVALKTFCNRIARVNCAALFPQLGWRSVENKWPRNVSANFKLTGNVSSFLYCWFRYVEAKRANRAMRYLEDGDAFCALIIWEFRSTAKADWREDGWAIRT